MHQLLRQSVGQFKIARAKLLRLDGDGNRSGRLGAGRIARVDHRHSVAGQIPGIGDQAEPLRGIAGHRETAKGVLADVDPGFVPVTARSEHDHFGATLVDVVANSIGGHTRRFENHGHLERRGVRVGGEIVRHGLHHESCRAVIQTRRLALARVEDHCQRRFVPVPAQPRGSAVRRKQRIGYAALFHRHAHFAHAVRIDKQERDRCAEADARHHRVHLDRRMTGQRHQRPAYNHHNCQQYRKSDFHFFTQLSNQSRNVWYQNKVLRGFNTQ